MLYNIIHCFGGHYKCRGDRPRHGGRGGGTNPPPPLRRGALTTTAVHSTMTANAIYSVIIYAIILYSIYMNIKHES